MKPQEKPKGKVIKAQRLSSVLQDVVSPLQILSVFCYNYPQYTLAEARKLPFKHVQMMLKEARKEQARHYLELTQIAAAPHTKKGQGVKRLVERYKRELNG